jgi:membrane-associated phospholipid phosphatase
MYVARTRTIILLCIAGAWLWPARGLADSPYELDLSVDLPLLGLGGAGSLVALIEVPPPACLPACSPDGINALDRSVLGNYSQTAHDVADVMVLGLVAAPALLDLADSGGDGWVQDMTVYTQALLLTQALTQITKFAVRRTAPFAYDPEVPQQALRSRDAPRAFFSGHTSTAFAATTTYTVTYWLRHPDDPLRWAVLTAGVALSTAVALLKIEAGYHFWTDVAAGALVGASIGTLVPLLHTRQ